MMPIFIITPETKAKAERLAKARVKSKNPLWRNNTSGWHSNPERWYPHLIGVLGEMCYAKMMGLDNDTTLLEKGDECDFGDIEIKTRMSERYDPQLIIKDKEYEKKNPKAYVLFRTNKSMTKYWCNGGITREDFKRYHQVKEYKHGRCRVVYHDLLNPIKQQYTGTYIV